MLDAGQISKDRRWQYEMDWVCVPAGASFGTAYLDLLLISNVASPHAIGHGEAVLEAMQGGGAWQAVLFTASLRQAPGSDVQDLRVVDAALGLVQVQASLEAARPVWLCTANTQPSSSTSANGHAGLWGLARACRRERVTLPLWCIDVQTGEQGTPTVVQHHAFRLQGGSVRGLQLSESVEPETALSAAGLHVPRLVAPYGAQPTLVCISFEAVCGLLDIHLSREAVALDMELLLPAHVLLETVCQQYVRDALQSLDAAMVPVWHHKLLYAWCAKQLPPGSRQSILFSDVRAAHPDLWPEVQLAERCGPRLVDALLGAVTYQELLFPGGSLELALALYEHAVISAFYNKCVVAVVEAVLSELAAGCRIVALEVGAGTGGTASSVLPILVGACELYIFTDVSLVFLRQARARFAEYRFLDYSLLNISADSRLQGFSAHVCDMIISTNVLHATPSMCDALINCNQLLRAGGVLVVNDVLATTALTQITFGMTDGWWLFGESGDEERTGQDSPLLSWRQWESLLVNGGLRHTHCMQGDSFLQSQAVIVAQAAAPCEGGSGRSALVDGSHYFSGGLGGLGLLTARLLLEGGAQQVVLSSRSDRVVGGSEGDWAWLAQSSGSVRRVRSDASDAGVVRSVLQVLHGDGLRVGGVFHAAHQLSDATLTSQHALNFRAAYGPKVHGAVALHAASWRAPLRLFNVYSSIAGLMGSAGQAPHSAVSAWLDTVAVCRRRGGVASQSVNWGAVSEIGYAARHGADQRAEVSGLGAISRAMAIAALGRTLLPGCRIFVVLPADWSKLLAGTGSAQGFAAPYYHLHAGHMSLPTSFLHPSTSPPVQTGFLGLQEVVELVRRAAGADRVDIDLPLMDQGVDSLSAVALSHQLQLAAGASSVIPSQLTFDHPTVRALFLFLSFNSSFSEWLQSEPPGRAASAVDVAGTAWALPGGVGPVWRMAATASDMVSEVPLLRWDPHESHDPDPSIHARMRHGAFVRGIDLFDSVSAAISPTEAGAMDPQQRLLLEHAYGAAHTSGCRRGGLRGELTGIFLGVRHITHPPMRRDHMYLIAGPYV